MRVKGAEKRRQKIIEEDIGDTGKKVFLVEGEDDQNAFSELTEKKFGDEFGKRWVISPAGGKQLVIGILVKEPDWIGLVDRDEWTEETASGMTAEIPNLKILPRFCLENYLIEPDEIWEALPEIQKNKITGGIEQLKTEILADYEKWVRHGVLRTVIQPLWDGLISQGFQSDLLDFENAQDDRRIQTILEQWHRFLNPDSIFRKFEEKLEQVGRLSAYEQITRWIDGKTFFNSHVHNVLNRFLGQASESDRKQQIFKGLIPPDDLNFLWQLLG